jgi:hypothetical protein
LLNQISILRGQIVRLTHTKINRRLYETNWFHHCHHLSEVSTKSGRDSCLLPVDKYSAVDASMAWRTFWGGAGKNLSWTSCSTLSRGGGRVLSYILFRFTVQLVEVEWRSCWCFFPRQCGWCIVWGGRQAWWREWTRHISYQTYQTPDSRSRASGTSKSKQKMFMHAICNYHWTYLYMYAMCNYHWMFLYMYIRK